MLLFVSCVDPDYMHGPTCDANNIGYSVYVMNYSDEKITLRKNNDEYCEIPKCERNFDVLVEFLDARIDHWDSRDNMFFFSEETGFLPVDEECKLFDAHDVAPERLRLYDKFDCIFSCDVKSDNPEQIFGIRIFEHFYYPLVLNECGRLLYIDTDACEIPVIVNWSRVDGIATKPQYILVIPPKGDGIGTKEYGGKVIR